MSDLRSMTAQIMQKVAVQTSLVADYLITIVAGNKHPARIAISDFIPAVTGLAAGGNFRLDDAQFEDLKFTVDALRVSGTKPPEAVAYKGSFVLAFEDALEANEESVSWVMQLPHSWKEGTDLKFHVHWVPEDNTAGNVHWTFTHSWANVDEAFPEETTVTAVAAAPAVADKHTIAPIGTIDGTGKTLSSMMLCSLKRTSGNELDTFTAKDAYLLEVDFHYEVDKLGSDNEYSNDS